jgi:hypothetical protein
MQAPPWCAPLVGMRLGMRLTLGLGESIVHRKNTKDATTVILREHRVMESQYFWLYIEDAEATIRCLFIHQLPSSLFSPHSIA